MLYDKDRHLGDNTQEIYIHDIHIHTHTHIHPCTLTGLVRLVTAKDAADFRDSILGNSLSLSLSVCVCVYGLVRHGESECV